jgi:hypothetical protein
VFHPVAGCFQITLGRTLAEKLTPESVDCSLGNWWPRPARQQIIVLRRTAPKRLGFNVFDRMILVGLYRLFPDFRSALAIVSPETVVRWHRAGFRAYWRWKSRPRWGRPKVSLEIRHLIREMGLANPLWGAPRIHGELLKLGIAIGQTSVAKYMPRRRRPPSQGWRTFLRCTRGRVCLGRHPQSGQRRA